MRSVIRALFRHRRRSVRPSAERPAMPTRPSLPSLSALPAGRMGEIPDLQAGFEREDEEPERLTFLVG